MISLLIVDDHQLVRVALRRLLEDEGDLRVVGEASNGREAVELALKVKPDIVLMDVAMPDMDGMEATRRLLKKRKSGTRIILLTMYADPNYAARLLGLGASGYVVKDAAPEELVEAIRSVHGGKRFVSSALRESLALRVVEGDGAGGIDSLTDREFQVFVRLASGAKNREIAKELSVSVKTIDAHRLNLMAKLGVRTNAELVKLAIRHGVLKL